MSVDERPGRTAEEVAALRERIAADSLTSRRDYLRLAVTMSGGLAVGSVAVAAGIFHRHGDGAAPPKLVTAALAPGESVAFAYPGESDHAVALRMADGTLVAYSSICTHLACAVLWRADRGERGELYCPCHEGVFDPRTGAVTAGPPPRPLPRVLLEERADGIYAVGTLQSGEEA
ncbi:Rieske (2Fe-2S) protein [Catellatospora sp. NPDC049609]|uniref:QcrA and Rieske domain-containing protein n=1 Tax=Catellatospora sp. NPDC049609 TaxID=3155505 RepID=UPI0034137B8D